MAAHKMCKYNYIANNVSKGNKYKIICIYDYTHIAKNRQFLELLVSSGVLGIFYFLIQTYTAVFILENFIDLYM